MTDGAGGATRDGRPGRPVNRIVTSVAALVGVERRRVVSVLDGLVGRHLVQQPAFGRYALHDLLRAYGTLRRLEQDGAEAARMAVARAAEWPLTGLEGLRPSYVPASRRSAFRIARPRPRTRCRRMS